MTTEINLTPEQRLQIVNAILNSQPADRHREQAEHLKDELEIEIAESNRAAAFERRAAEIEQAAAQGDWARLNEWVTKELPASAKISQRYQSMLDNLQARFQSYLEGGNLLAAQQVDSILTALQRQSEPQRSGKLSQLVDEVQGKKERLTEDVKMLEEKERRQNYLEHMSGQLELIAQEQLKRSPGQYDEVIQKLLKLEDETNVKLQNAVEAERGFYQGWIGQLQQKRRDLEKEKSDWGIYKTTLDDIETRIAEGLKIVGQLKAVEIAQAAELLQTARQQLSGLQYKADQARYERLDNTLKECEALVEWVKKTEIQFLADLPRPSGLHVVGGKISLLDSVQLISTDMKLVRERLQQLDLPIAGELERARRLLRDAVRPKLLEEYWGPRVRAMSPVFPVLAGLESEIQSVERVLPFGLALGRSSQTSGMVQPPIEDAAALRSGPSLTGLEASRLNGTEKQLAILKWLPLGLVALLSIAALVVGISALVKPQPGLDAVMPRLAEMQKQVDAHEAKLQDINTGMRTMNQTLSGMATAQARPASAAPATVPTNVPAPAAQATLAPTPILTLGVQITYPVGLLFDLPPLTLTAESGWTLGVDGQGQLVATNPDKKSWAVQVSLDNVPQKGKAELRGAQAFWTPNEDEPPAEPGPRQLGLRAESDGQVREASQRITITPALKVDLLQDNRVRREPIIVTGDDAVLVKEIKTGAVLEVVGTTKVGAITFLRVRELGKRKLYWVPTGSNGAVTGPNAYVEVKGQSGQSLADELKRVFNIVVP